MEKTYMAWLATFNGPLLKRMTLEEAKEAEPTYEGQPFFQPYDTAIFDLSTKEGMDKLIEGIGIWYRENLDVYDDEFML